MRLQLSKTPNATSFYIVKSVYENKVRTSKIVEKLGTEVQLREKLNGQDPYEWAKAYVAELNRKEKEGKEAIIHAEYNPNTQIDKGVPVRFKGGYLFLQKLYHELGLDQICKSIENSSKIEYDLNSILSRLLYTRILCPGSKKNAFELSQRLIEPPHFDLHQVYRGLDAIQKNSDMIQAEVYKNSVKHVKRNTNVLYYDCTNFFFEIEEENGLRQYGVSKEHRPNPIVQMGLFMDGDGIPLSFCISKGNTNEQGTLKPLEKQILRDFELSKFIVCTDAGLSSKENRQYNVMGERSFITVQSIKTLKSANKEWALEPKGWRLQGSHEKYDISSIDEVLHEKSIFYKEQWLEIGGVMQRLVVTYSIAYRNYLASIRERQITRLVQTIEKNPSSLSRKNPSDNKRFLTTTHCTKEGEVAKTKIHSINEEAIAKEAMYDGFYGICTNLDGDISQIIAINKRRWEIEECFRIMKTEFKARPVYLSVDERIEAHFLTCFLSLILLRLMEKRLDGQYTASELISQLRDMDFQLLKGQGYIPLYQRTDLTDSLHAAFGFQTDKSIVSLKQMKAIQRFSKKSL